MDEYPEYVLSYQFPISIFKKALKEYKIGKILWEEDKYENAARKFQKATELDPNYEEAYFYWGHSLFMLEDYDGAIEKFIKCPNRADAYHYWGHSLAEIKDYDGAIEKFEKSKDLDPSDTKTYYCWGRLLLFDLKHYEEAIEKFEQCIKIDPNHIDAYNEIAHTLYFQGEYNEAKRKWKNAQELYDKELQNAISKKDVDFFSEFGTLLCCNISDLTKAENIYKMGLKLEPNNIDILLGLVHLYIGHLHEEYKQETKFYWHGRENYKKAESVLKDKLSKEENVDTLYQLGDLYLEVEEYEYAENFLLKAFEKDKDSSDICIDLGLLYLGKECFNKAIKYLEAALKIDPDSLVIKNFLAEAYLREKLIDDAEKKYREVYDIAHYNIDSLIGLGEVYINMGENSDDDDMYNDAIIYFSKVIDIIQLEKEKASKELNNRELADIYYSRGYARIKLYEIDKDESLLHDAKKDFENCFKYNPLNYKGKRSKEKIDKEIGTFSSLKLIEKIGPWSIFGLSIFIFIKSQYIFFVDKSVDIDFYTFLTFGSLIFIIVGISLPQILKMKFVGIEIEKNPIQIAHRKDFKIKKLRNHLP